MLMVTGRYCISIYSDLAATPTYIYSNSTLYMWLRQHVAFGWLPPQSVENKVISISRILHILKVGDCLLD